MGRRFDMYSRGAMRRLSGLVISARGGLVDWWVGGLNVEW